MTRAEKAVAQFETASACSQSVAVAFAEDMGMDFSTVHKAMSAFGGGMGTRQFTCGAVTGGLFALGALFGSEGPEQAEAKARTKVLSDRFMDAVEERLGALSCRELLGGRSLEEAGAMGMFSSECPGFVRVCAEEVERIFEEEGR